MRPCSEEDKSSIIGNHICRYCDTVPACFEVRNIKIPSIYKKLCLSTNNFAFSKQNILNIIVIAIKVFEDTLSLQI